MHKAGNFEAASGFYTDALERRAEFPEALVNLGHALNESGRTEEADACWTRLAEAFPEAAREYFVAT